MSLSRISNIVSTENGIVNMLQFHGQSLMLTSIPVRADNPLHAEPEILDELADFGVDLFSTANNHSFDFGLDRILSTMNALEERNQTYAGMGLDLPDARGPEYIQTGGGRVGFVHSTTGYLAGAEAGKPSSFVGGRPGINPLHVEWTYYVTKEQYSHLQDVAEATGISRVKGLWLKREAARRETDSNFAFMHMTFEPVETSPTLELVSHSSARTVRLC